MVLLNDPAGLAYLHGNQILFDVNVEYHSMCVKPYGYYGWGAYGNASSEFGDPLKVDNPTHPTIGATYATTPLPQVCNSAPETPVPQLAWAGRITKRLAIGFGQLAPVVVGGLQYGGADGTIQTPYGPRPTPTRYSLVKQDATFALSPVIGAAYRFLDQLSAGLSLQILMVKAEATEVQNEVSGTQPSTDWLAHLTAQDYFIPSVTFSVHAKPIRALDLVATFHYTDNFRGSGQVTYETNTFHRGATSGPVPYVNAPIALDQVTVGQPWQLTTAIRYAGMLPGDPPAPSADRPAAGDPMDTELWDAEVDVGYTLNGLARDSVNVGHDVTVKTETANGTIGSVTTSGLPEFQIDPHGETSYSIRVGGSYSIVPRTAAIHAGCFYESRGVQPAYADIDTFAFQRIGVGLGFVVRLGKVDLRGGYSHIFSETLDVAPPPNQPVEDAQAGNPQSGFDERVGGTFGQDGTRRGGVVLTDPSAPSPSNADATAAKTQASAIATASRPDRVINAGKYTAAFNVVSVGIAYHF